MSGVRIKYGRSPLENLAADVDIDGHDPYFTIIDAYNNPIQLLSGGAGHIKKIRNDSGVTITINVVDDVHGAATNTITIDDNSHLTLMYVSGTENDPLHWVMIDKKVTGVTLS